MEFDLCDLSGHEAKMNRHPKEPMWKLYTKFQIVGSHSSKYHVETVVDLCDDSDLENQDHGLQSELAS